MQKELYEIDKVIHKSQKPVTAIIGGAKVSSKIAILTNLLDKVDNILIGGGMAYTFAKALGGQVGNSKVEKDKLEEANTILGKAKSKNVKVCLPKDSIIADAFNKDANSMISATNEIPVGWMGLDIGEDTMEEYANMIAFSKTLLWNGPMGVFEFEKFSKGTEIWSGP